MEERVYFGGRISRLFFAFFQIALFLFIPFSSFSDTSKTISNTGVKSINIGDHAKSVHAVFSSPYEVIDSKIPQWARKIVVYEKGKKILEFSIDDKGKIFLIDIFGDFKTKEGIGIGSSLALATQVYGQGSIEPTDIGYYVYFENFPGVMFLLNNSEIPEDLRGIPDDVITDEDENKILKLKDVKISTIQIFKKYE